MIAILGEIKGKSVKEKKRETQTEADQSEVKRETATTRRLQSEGGDSKRSERQSFTMLCV